MLPRHRDYYDVADRLWKTEIYEDVTSIDGVPTPLRIRMEDKQAGTSTEIQVRNLRSDAQLPEEIFDPLRLAQTVTQLF